MRNLEILKAQSRPFTGTSLIGKVKKRGPMRRACSPRALGNKDARGRRLQTVSPQKSVSPDALSKWPVL